jgi:hypothetical protein
VNQEQPNINTYDSQDYFNAQDEFDLNKLNFKIAFGVVDYHNSQPLQDSSYVRFNVFLEERKDL